MKYEAEYGSIQPIRFAQGALRDSTGEEILCKCGKPSGCAIIGKEASIAYCQDCSPFSKDVTEFVFKTPHAH